MLRVLCLRLIAGCVPTLFSDCGYSMAVVDVKAVMVVVFFFLYLKLIIINFFFFFSYSQAFPLPSQVSAVVQTRPIKQYQWQQSLLEVRHNQQRETMALAHQQQLTKLNQEHPNFSPPQRLDKKGAFPRQPHAQMHWQRRNQLQEANFQQMLAFDQLAKTQKAQLRQQQRVSFLFRD